MSQASPAPGQDPPTHVLLTNDDGYDRDGLQALRRALVGAGFRVTVVAPAVNQSGVARAVTCRRPVKVRLHDEDGDGNRVYSCEGTPVDCVRVAVLSDLVAPVDLVASGINHGVNLGDDSTFSGTLGGALEGALLGLPAIAFSQQDDAGDISLVSRGRHHFLATDLAVRACRLLVEHPPPKRLAVNVNLPHHVEDPPVEVSRVSPFAYPHRWTPAEQVSADTWQVWSYAKPGQPDPHVDVTTGTDYAAVLNGSASVSMVRGDWDGNLQTPLGAGAWLDDFVQRLATRLSGSRR